MTFRLILFALILSLTSCGGIANVGPALTPLQQHSTAGSDFPAPQRANRTARVIPPPPPPAPSVANLAGAWEFQFIPTPSTTSYYIDVTTLIEANLQQSGADVTSTNSATSVQSTMLSKYPTEILFGSPCEGYTIGSLAGTVSDNSFTLSVFQAPVQPHPIGTLDRHDLAPTMQATATINPDGTLAGTYTSLICPYDNAGTFSGAKTAPFGGTYAGTILVTATNSVETLSLTLTEHSDFTLSVTGMDNGVPFDTMGYAVGSFLETTTDIGIAESFAGYLPPHGSAMEIWNNSTGDSGFLQLQN